MPSVQVQGTGAHTRQPRHGVAATLQPFRTGSEGKHRGQRGPVGQWEAGLVPAETTAAIIVCNDPGACRVFTGTPHRSVPVGIVAVRLSSSGVAWSARCPPMANARG